MSSKLTTYRRPSIAELLATAPNIAALARFWSQLAGLRAAGEIHADPKTILAWIEACWTRVGELIANAPDASTACLVFNTVYRWKKPPGVHEALRALLLRTVRDLPDEVEQLARAGIVIEGVSTPAQHATAARARKAIA